MAWIKLFFRGKETPIPLWVVILEAANGDPLRAQEIDEKLGREWWEYWQIYNREKAQAMNERMKDIKNGE